MQGSWAPPINYRRLQAAQTPDDPDAGLRAWLRSYVSSNPCHWFRRAWAALRFDEGSVVNKKRVHRLWREEGLQVRAYSPRKRAGQASTPTIAADAPKVVWTLDFLQHQLNPIEPPPDSISGWSRHRGPATHQVAAAALSVVSVRCRRERRCGRRY
ncbi:IS3 family transposase [Nocardia sp. NPDC003979]